MGSEHEHSTRTDNPTPPLRAPAPVSPTDRSPHPVRTPAPVSPTNRPPKPGRTPALVISTGGPASPGRNGEISTRPEGPCRPRPNVTTTPRRAFTLIELLVVVSIITLLMALLFPALQRAKKQAQAVVCQTRLRQLGLSLSIYSNENHGKAPSDRGNVWPLVLRTKQGEYPELALCPSAVRLLPGRAVSRGDTFHAGSGLMGRPNLRASFGYNRWVNERLNKTADGKMVVGTANGKPIFWGRCDVKQAGNIPVFFDCSNCGVLPSHFEAPPEYEGAEGRDTGPSVADLCINRHSGGTNMLFMDWSARKVGLKEHWTFSWSRQFDTTGPWTTAGGALPTDWPQWMRRFKDY